MKGFLSCISAILLSHSAYSQITITAADMPVAGDTLRYSIASPLGATISPGDSGANFTWNYPLSPTAQAIDNYETAAEVSLLYTLEVGPSAIGYLVEDSLPAGLGAFLPVTVSQLYTFFEEATTPASYEAMAFGAEFDGFPNAFRYSKPDAWYYFPLTYANHDSSDYALDISLDTTGIKESGYRKTRVDGWGTITTPYYTTPVNCIRVRSEIHEIDSVSFDGFSFGIPNNTVQYKWLVNGEHFPALWVTSALLPGGLEVISSIWYRDSARVTDTAIDNAAPSVSKIRTDIKAYPNPAYNGSFTLGLPTDWKTFSVEIFDMQSKEAGSFSNEREINIQSLPPGQYIVRVISGNNIAYIPITR